ncbi:MAG: hypothetical protein WCK35_23210 [Chloroflexota bacterium]
MIKINSQQVRPLKGAPLSVLALLERAEAPLSNQLLERLSGYSDKPVSQACYYLKMLGLVDHTPSGWFLAPGILVSEVSGIITDPINIIIPDSNQKSINNNNNKNIKGRNISAAETQKIWEILSAAGIRQNERTRELLQKEHVTPEYISAKLAEYKDRGLAGSQWTGLLIRVLESGEPAPPLAENGHPQNCSCVHCEVERFRRGSRK